MAKKGEDLKRRPKVARSQWSLRAVNLEYHKQIATPMGLQRGNKVTIVCSLGNGVVGGRTTK